MITAFGLLVLAFLASWLWTWGKIALRLRAGQPILPMERRRAVRWTLVDVALVAIFYLSTNLVLLRWVPRPQGVGAAATADRADREAEPAGKVPAPEVAVRLLLLSAMANLLSAAFAVALLRFRSGATWDELGLSLERLPQDARLGWFAFAAVGPPIYALQALLSEFFPKQHPLVEMLRESRSTELLIVSFVSAVVVAPLVEEFFFRAVLQGWLGRIASGDRGTYGSPSALEPPGVASPPGAESGFAPPLAPGETPASENPYASPSAFAADVQPAEPRDPSTLVARTAWAPILVSSAIFAAMHLGHGPAPIPLFFLALALGWIYQRTGRLAPCVTMHLCLNGTSMLALFATLDR